jgi:hypothetical protein
MPFPSRLWGEVRGGGKPYGSDGNSYRERSAIPPPNLPHKGGGTRMMDLATVGAL